jgi:hypothetical protein
MAILYNMTYDEIYTFVMYTFEFNTNTIWEILQPKYISIYHIIHSQNPYDKMYAFELLQTPFENC